MRTITIRNTKQRTRSKKNWLSIGSQTVGWMRPSRKKSTCERKAFAWARRIVTNSERKSSTCTGNSTYYVLVPCAHVIIPRANIKVSCDLTFLINIVGLFVSFRLFLCRTNVEHKEAMYTEVSFLDFLIIFFSWIWQCPHNLASGNNNCRH